MEVTFSTKKLQKICNSEKKLRGEYGPRMAQLIMRRLADLSAAENLEQMRSLPGRCHALTQDLDGHFALDLVHPERLVFKPDHDPLPELTDGSIDWKNVTEIQVTDIGDYH
jgi:plasmid maintenance system killer protein